MSLLLVLLLAIAYGLWLVIRPPLDWLHRMYPYSAPPDAVQVRLVGGGMVLMAVVALILGLLPGGALHP